MLEALADLSHATGEELLARVRAGTPEVNLSTIYRTLEVLSEVGLVTHAHLHHGAVTYHAVGGPAHIHLVCRGCAQVSSAPVAVAEPLATQVATLTGFTADLSHVVLHGLCARCRESGTPGPRPTLGAP